MMRLLSAGVAAFVLGGCATARGRSTTVDLAPARQALEQARQAGAPEKAPQAYGQAEGRLKTAEELAAAHGPAAFTAAATPIGPRVVSTSEMVPSGRRENPVAAVPHSARTPSRAPAAR